MAREEWNLGRTPGRGTPRVFAPPSTMETASSGASRLKQKGRALGFDAALPDALDFDAD